MLLLATGLALAQLSAPTASADVPTPAAQAAVSPTPAEQAPPGELGERPPPSTYDRAQRAAGSPTPDAVEEERSWASQLWRTVLALGVVIGLIYLVFKVGVTKLMGVAPL